MTRSPWTHSANAPLEAAGWPRREGLPRSRHSGHGLTTTHTPRSARSRHTAGRAGRASPRPELSRLTRPGWPRLTPGRPGCDSRPVGGSRPTHRYTAASSLVPPRPTRVGSILTPCRAGLSLDPSGWQGSEPPPTRLDEAMFHVKHRPRVGAKGCTSGTRNSVRRPSEAASALRRALRRPAGRRGGRHRSGTKPFASPGLRSPCRVVRVLRTSTMTRSPAPSQAARGCPGHTQDANCPRRADCPPPGRQTLALARPHRARPHARRVIAAQPTSGRPRVGAT